MSPQNQLTVGSLFSGIGGLELGLERAGMRTVWQVEKDEYCRRVLAKHWPEVGRFEDVKDVGAHNLQLVDLICGGFPCQDVSHLGKRAGLISGTRSGLWYEFARILGELRPRYVIVENVSNLLADGMGAVLGELARLGYDAEWSVLPACAFGAPHTRERVFILAYARGLSLGSAGPERAIGSARGARDNHFGGMQTDDWRQLRQVDQSQFLRVTPGLPDQMDRNKALGNSVVPQVAEYIGRLIVEADKEMRGAA